MERALAADRWICLDIGETLIDETRVWSTWASVLGVTPLVLMATMGAEIAAGRSYDSALTRIDPTWPDRMEEKESAYGGFRPDDLYPDALPALDAYRRAGLGVAVIGNQPSSRTAELRAIGVRPDVMAMSDELGVSKPDPAFFAAALHAMGDVPADRVTYVGDRVDNDVIAASEAGLRTIHLRRGPWGLLGPRADGRADAVVDGLLEILDHI